MDMVRHDGEDIEGNVRVLFAERTPCVFDPLAGWRISLQPHRDFAKQRLPVMVHMVTKYTPLAAWA